MTLFVALPVALIRCVARQEPRAREPVRWIVVEKRTGDLMKEGVLVDRPLHESSTLLAMQPLYAEDLNWLVKVEAPDFFVELLEIVPTPSNRAVRILSHQEVIVRGSVTATYEFSSLVPGVAGIAITVDKLEGEDP